MVIAGLTKQPAEIIRQRIDLTQWLDQAMISVAEVKITPADDASLVMSTAVELGRRTLSVFMDGGQHNTRYTITVLVTTTDGRRREDEIELRVREIG